MITLGTPRRAADLDLGVNIARRCRVVGAPRSATLAGSFRSARSQPAGRVTCRRHKGWPLPASAACSMIGVTLRNEPRPAANNGRRSASGVAWSRTARVGDVLHEDGTDAAHNGHRQQLRLCLFLLPSGASKCGGSRVSHRNQSMDRLTPYMAGRDITVVRLSSATATAPGICTTLSRGAAVWPRSIARPAGPDHRRARVVVPENRRTLTFECVADGELLALRYRDLEQLYLQNSGFGCYFLRLASERLSPDARRLEQARRAD